MQDISVFLFQHTGLSIAILILLVILFGIELIRLKQRAQHLSPSQLTFLINKKNAVLIDVRPPEAYASGHIAGAISLTPSAIRTQPKKLEKYKSKPLIILCANAQESQKIAATLVKQGFDAHILSGGMRSWLNGNMPVIKETI